MPAIQAQVIATFSRRMRVRLAGGVEVEARIKGKRMRPVCGDRVSVEPIPNEDDWLITAIEDRINALTRPNLRGDVEVLAANVDKLVVVAAPAPMPDWFVVDRYVAAAEQMGIQAAIVYNKTDLDLDAAEHKEILADYGNIGYPVLECSAAQRSGLDALEALLSNHRAAAG
jgi:ribosome biogenesis GTPase